MNIEFTKDWWRITLGEWNFTIYWVISVWTLFDAHYKSHCCWFWLIIGPFEISRSWTEDEYGNAFPEDV